MPTQLEGMTWHNLNMPRMFKGGKELEDYEGNRSSSSLVDFAKQHEILGTMEFA